MISVSSLNIKIKSLLETTFMHILVEGEVASVTYHTSGHLYFSIKDDKSTIKCVMWRSSVARMKFRIEKGMHIVVEGSVSVYTPRGEYQFQTVKIEPYGQGALALAFEQLKEKLKSKGYFDTQQKKILPKKIRKIVLVTAKESAALHDMIKIIEKRWPLVEVVVIDVLVQGESAAEQISHGLYYADSLGADIIVVGRGGGSTEDLWAFNEESVADAIFAIHTPVVSAVGHEVDVLISDYVADLRAPTPSAAIEMILPDRNEMLYVLNETTERFGQTIQQHIGHKEQQLNHSQALLLQHAPKRKLQEIEHTFVRLQEEFLRTIYYRIEQFGILSKQLQREFEQNITFVFRNKVQQALHLHEKMKLSDPKLQCRTGWAKISKQKKTVGLDQIGKDEYFTVEDAFVQIDAVCLEAKRKI
ncbi:MAG: exodeoxyribonuclease VII large subunit [Sulfurovum sp.]|nr:exodeoxyribonuclease VII large subunit [Sulfurovum sp.]MCB4761953.1 exodeoxyribonuclease VII large subunit [Sulfurovum sp.]MCB4777075.1 exodeoxyribonuclease VII large subunit [Sulfurovum sp.]MCB4780290.1 exodeoxyribonuclease VII large subunit [Sulfurovum sp.]MCB4783999.1 exodeoxyribonuclease VII large subunit [Sulfurovum sp.]